MTVLADKSLQRWLLNANGIETFLFEEIEISKKIRDTFHQKLWANRGSLLFQFKFHDTATFFSLSDPVDIEVWSLDMQGIDNGVVILAAATNLSHTPQIHYSLSILFKIIWKNLI